MKKLTLTTAAAAAILCLNSLTAFAADTTKHGYGQGTAVDNLNRPIEQSNSTHSTAELMPTLYLKLKTE